MEHRIKCWPQYYSRVIDGSKTFEMRVNDRGYQPGDEVVMNEWDPTEIEKRETYPLGEVDEWKEPKGYTGRACTFKIGYILPIEDKRVVFSVLNLKEL